MINLPEWKLTLCAPLYDTASKSPTEMTAQVYAKMRELVEEYNQFASDMTKTINDHIVKSNEDVTEFEKNITCLMQNYIESVDKKLLDLSEDIKAELKVYINEAVAEEVIAYNEETEEIVIGGTT